MTYRVILYLDEEASRKRADALGQDVESIMEDLVAPEFTVIVRGATDTADAIRALYRWLDSGDSILTNIPELVFSIGIEVLSANDSNITYIDCIAEIEL